MKYLPRLPYSTQQKHAQILQFRGINLTDNYPLGSAVDSENISTQRYPYITTRNDRGAVESQQVFSLFHWDKLITFRSQHMYIDDVMVSGALQSTEKQFAVVNTKLVIFPDKAYVDMSEPANARQIRSLENEAKGTGGVVFNASDNTITIPTVDSGVFSEFKANDVIKISGCATTNNNKYIRIASVDISGSVVVTVDDAYSVIDSGTEGAAVKITFARNVPNMDFICASENRLWGCSSKTQTIYASALGDPTNFYAFIGLDSDSYTIPVGTEGDFTGCCAYGSSVLFWKEDLVHKVLGGFPDQYQIYTYNINGVKKGCYKSLVNVNDTLFYVSLHGICTYTGGGSGVLSSALGETEFDNAAAGSDGENYYISAETEGKWNLWCYSMKTGLWVREDETRVIAFTNIGKTVYGIKYNTIVESLPYGYIFILDNDQPIDSNTPWFVQFTPFIETVTGTYGAKSSIFAKKRYGRMRFRVDIPRGSYMVASVRMDGGRWAEAGRIVGDKAGTQTMVVPIKSCDKFEIKLEGKGPCTILNFDREYTIGSER